LAEELKVLARSAHRPATRRRRGLVQVILDGKLIVTECLAETATSVKSDRAGKV
jgi:hypothetical protein